MTDAPAPGGDLTFLPATRLRDALASGELSSREATSAFLAQIDRVNPSVNAVVTLVADQALAAADAADEAHAAARRAGDLDTLPVLHGMPMLHKDTHFTAGIRTTQGSPVFAHRVPREDDLLIERLHATGVVSMGKTNVPEFAAGSHTFNPVFGRTDNPYDLSRTAGGSSGGAAVALATGMTPLSDGSDMGGSLRNPAGFCNVVGLRPSPGRVPNTAGSFGVWDLSTSGPMARSVDDLALLLSAMAGPDLRAPASLSEPGAPLRTVAELDPSTLRIAVSGDFGGRTPVEHEVVRIVEEAGRVFEGLGATVEQTMPDLTGAPEAFTIRRGWQFAAAFGPLVDARPGDVKEAIRWNVELGRRLTREDLTKALALTDRLYQRVREFFETYDALLVPTASVLPFDGGQEYPTQINGQELPDYLEWMRVCSDISATGAPAISVPGGFSGNGLPVGVQIVTQHRAEAKLLAIAKVYEGVTRFAERRPPIV